MILFKKADALREWLARESPKRGQTGFVPTMGALHEGHISLLEAAIDITDITLCSIFVNPAQFNDPKDFEKYPITIENDIFLLEKAGVDVLFLPEADELYPYGISSLEHYELGSLETILEGRYRPGHFQGVCQVMQRLLGIIQPSHLFMGRKDYQQCMVVNRLLELMHSDSIFHRCPTVREKDGLAMSSRNMRLNEISRKRAPSIYNSLLHIKNHIKPGNCSVLKEQAIAILVSNGFQVDYFEVADAESLQPVDSWDGEQSLIAITAAFLDGVRLIDNMDVTTELK